MKASILIQFNFIIVIVILLSCTDDFNNKTCYISQYESWINELESEYKTYTVKEWEEVEMKFKKFSELEYQKFQGMLTDSDKERLDKLTGQYYAVLTKYKAMQINNELKSLINKSEGFINGLQNGK